MDRAAMMATKAICLRVILLAPRLDVLGCGLQTADPHLWGAATI
jgi:hypothetical protein